MDSDAAEEVKAITTAAQRRPVATALAAAAAFVALVMVGNGFYDYVRADVESDDAYADDWGWDNCNVAGINLHGQLYTYIPENADSGSIDYSDAVSSEYILSAIDDAEANADIKAIVLEVDSWGGSPVAAEEIANRLKGATIPTIAFIREAGDSAAYWAATGADTIYASKNSDIGAIGVTSSFTQDISPNARFIQIASGKFKDTGNPDKVLTEEEHELLLRDVKIVYENFIADVAANRALPVDRVRELADGSSMLGEAALQNGLIDSIGGFYTVSDDLETELGEPVSYCWY